MYAGGTGFQNTLSAEVRILTMIATRGFLTALECAEFVFGRGSVPDSTRGAYGGW